MTGREVHRVSATGSYRGTLLALDRLVEQGIVEARRVGQAREYRLNEEHLAYPALAAALAAFTPRTDLDDRLRALVHEHLPDESDVSLAYFGSFARGEAGVDSDIDLLLVVPDGTAHELLERIVDDLETRGRRWTGNEIQVYATRHADLERAVAADDPIVAEWQRDAVTILGPTTQRLLEAIR
ncbi:nucleotidyltransferase family protein [Kineococcus vitellinus]|uniref:nucleotidyltransferase family protein n=1 Tax=Kineococcus vitellinus TaxID=2696565 RepID=UPI00141373B0|nr:nucleotidyltransferase domain-containing protein [Kineococcus vitellinus]